jgi:hypothetical protein
MCWREVIHYNVGVKIFFVIYKDVAEEGKVEGIGQ